MDNETILNTFEKEPMGEVSKKDRKALLGLSLAGYAILNIGIIPSKIPALGIEFTSTNKEAILTVLVLSIGYFLLAFLIHSVSDFLSYRREWFVWTVKNGMELSNEQPDEKGTRLEVEEIIKKEYALSPAPTNLLKWIKLLFDFVLPFYFGLHVLISLA